MCKTTLILLISMLLLVSCASPALPPTETPTAQPSLTPTVTQTPAPTETPEPTPTATPVAISGTQWQEMSLQEKLAWMEQNPFGRVIFVSNGSDVQIEVVLNDLPEGLQVHIAEGGGFDGEAAWDSNGRVLWLYWNGEWENLNGVVLIPPGDGSNSPPLEVKYFVNMESLLRLVREELPKANDLAWKSFQAAPQKEVEFLKAKYWKPIRDDPSWANERIKSRYMTVVDPSDPTNNTEIMVESMKLPNGKIVTRVSWASKQTQYFIKWAFTDDNLKDLLEFAQGGGLPIDFDP